MPFVPFEEQYDAYIARRRANALLQQEEPEMPAPSRRASIPLQAGKSYRLRDMVNKIYCAGRSADQQFWLCECGPGQYRLYNDQGTRADGTQTNHDAVMEWRELVRVQRTGFQNVYHDHTFSEIYTSRSEADASVDLSKTRIACIDMTMEIVEGTGLE
jgi:hypothetical protein